MVFNEAAEIPKKLQIISSQLIICLFNICSFKSAVFEEIERPAEQPDGPFNNLFSTPTCHIE